MTVVWTAPKVVKSMVRPARGGMRAVWKDPEDPRETLDRLRGRD